MTSRSMLALCCCLAACGRLGFDVIDDAEVSIDSASDAGVDPRAPWGPVETVTLPTIGPDDDPSLSSDLLELYFNRSGDLFLVTRTDVMSPWGTPFEISLSVAAADDTPELAPDDLTMYFASSRAGTVGALDLWVATRPTPQSPWGTEQRVSELSSSALDASAVSSLDGLTVVFASTREGAAPNLFTASRTSTTEPWGPPVPLAELNTASDESSGHLSPDGLTLYFHSNRSGTFDLYVATRASLADPFGAPTRIDSVSTTTSDEQDPWVSPDGRELYFSSGRSGADRIYRATR